MALFNVSAWQRSRFTLQWFIINLVGSLACLTAVALAQFEWSEGVSGSVGIPDVAFTCIGNLAVFTTALMRGRLDMENGARDVLATTIGPKLNDIDGCGLTTRPPNDLRDVHVVMLSKYNHSSLTQFMQYFSHSHDLESILLQFLPIKSAPVTAGICECGDCQCVVFWATEEIMVMLARRLPGTLKRLSESQCLLPSLSCLRNGCHGCNQGLLYVEDLPDVEAAGESSEPGTSEGRLREDNPRVHSPAAVCEALKHLINEDRNCICIPVYRGDDDGWTKFLIKYLKSKEMEARGMNFKALDALENYTRIHDWAIPFPKTMTGSIIITQIYDSVSLIVPRVAELIVNIVLTGWLRVDGFSSSLVARRAIRDYVVDSTGTGFAANVFLTKAVVVGSADGTNVCQLLCFRRIFSLRRVSYIVGCVNLICSVAWSVLIAWDGNWAHSMPPSGLRYFFILGAVLVALAMDYIDFNSVPARARAHARARARIQARIRAQVRDRVWARARAQAQVQARARAQAQVQARARAQAQGFQLVGPISVAGARTWPEAQVQDQAQAQAQAQDQDQDQDQAQAQAQAQDQDQVQAQDQVWGLPAVVILAVVILEVGYLVSLYVMMGMNGGFRGLGTWVYSGMQLLVWVKWGIGSFLLGGQASQDKSIDFNPRMESV